MKRAQRRIACLLVFMAGCSRPSSGIGGAPAVEAAAPRAAAQVSITNLGPGRVAIVSNDAIELQTTATIEQRTPDGSWVAYEGLDGGRGFRLVEACDAPETTSPPCPRLEAGKPLLPVPWSGFSCSSQCNQNCDKNVPRPGRHRLVIRDCHDPARRFEGPPFEMPSSSQMVARWRAAASLESGSAVRLQPRPPRNGPSTGNVETIAGVRLRAGARSSLSAELLAQLGTWLRSPTGFDDVTERRCAPGTMFGLVLVRQALPQLRETTEVAIDLGCRAIFLVNQEGSTRATTHSHFDPSRSELLSWAKRALPAEPDIARAR